MPHPRLPRSAAAFLAVLLAVTPATAQERQRGGWMSSDAIRQEFSGRLLNGIYPNTSPWPEQTLADCTTAYRALPKHHLRHS